MSEPASKTGWGKILIPLAGMVVVGLLLVSPEGPGSLPTAPQAKEGPSAESPFAHLPGYVEALELQTAFVRNAKNIKPSVVGVNSLRKASSPRFSHSRNEGPSSWFGRLVDRFRDFSRNQYQMENLGSGVLYNNSGYIVTNYHVIEDAGRLLVQLHDGRNFRAKVIGTDPKTDLAVIKIFSFRNFRVPPFGKSEGLHVGEWIMAIGNPYGLDGTVTVGVVSAKGRDNLGIAVYENFIQTDASINPGNSGGPLVNLKGEIIGINTAVAALGAGLGFAIPIDMARRICDELIRNGGVERGWLGVGIQALTPDLADSLKISFHRGGVLVNGVEERTPAMRAGLRQGDVILDFDGQPIAGTKNLQNLVASTRVGKRVPVRILRDGHEKTLRLIVGKLVS